MSLYTRARKHIDMNRVKELREEKIKREQIAEILRQQEEIRAELAEIEAKESKHVDWRRELEEGMTTASLGMINLPAEGDTDLIDYGFDDTYISPSPDEYGYDDVSTGAGTGSGYQGGFPVADGRSDVIQLSAFGEYSASAYSTDQDLSTVDTLSITAIAGNGTNGGLTPVNGLQAYFLDNVDIAGPFDVISSTQSSYATVQVSIPENMRKKGVQILLYSDTSDYVNGMNFSVRHFGNQTFNVPGLDFTTIRNLFANDDPGEENGEDFLSFFFRRYSRDNPDNMKSIGFYYWYNVQNQRLGLVDTDRQGSEGGWWWAQWPSPPINPEKTYGDSGNNYVGGPEDEDYIKIGEMIWDQFVGTKLYGISKISLKRRSAMNVFVPLDDPDASAFVRDGDFDRLSPADKKKKLEEQLNSSEEYLYKMFGEGMPKGATEIADYEPQQSFMDIQAGGERITKQDGKTITDTTRGIKDGKMDGRPTYTDRQGNLRVSQPQPQLKPQPKSTTTTTTTTSNTDRTSITNVPTTSTYTSYTDAEKLEKDFSTNPNLLGRGLRSATDQARFAGDKMFQGNPAGRAPGLSNYWSPEPKTAATYSNPGKGKGIPGTGPNPTGTITTAQRPPGTPRVTRGITGTPQFKFPAGSPPPSNMLTQMADDAAVSVANKAAATTASKTLSRVVPVVSIGIAVADAGIRASNGDYAGAVLSGLSAVPGPVGWAGLGVQIATDAAGFTGGVKEQQEFDNYGDYIKDAGKIAKKNKIKIDRNAMLDLFLRELSKDNKLSDKDKEFLVAIFTDADGLEKDDVITFVKKIQKKLMNGKSIEEQVTTKKKRLKSPKDLVDKIPGYYDGKPSPLGFPVEEPPKMKNGHHPDLVDGKKVSQRYNRLDPISAKAMPPTGNPHIDKKVRAAAKKPK